MARVAVLMSGGVDSSVAAALLKEQGHQVFGIHIVGWTGAPGYPCSWQEEERDAHAAAEHLGIPFYSLNLVEEYQREVVDSFIASYRAGLTPNPDILCNKEVKFAACWRALRQLSPDKMATGHYVRLSSRDGRPILAKAKDTNKDQSYFLWGIKPEMLDRVLFPLGELTKPEVRQLAKKYGLAVAGKKDSQGVCFVGPIKIRQFLREKLAPQEGEAYLTDGRWVAKHQGANLYTIGERLAAGSVAWTGDAPPLYVVAKDRDGNRLVVGSDAETFAQRLIAKDFNWFIPEPPAKFVASAKIRYRQEDVQATIIRQSGQYSIEFARPVRAIAPGQAIVLYQGDQLIAGGWIARSPEADELVRSLKIPNGQEILSGSDSSYPLGRGRLADSHLS